MSSNMSETPVPNRLVDVPPGLYEMVEEVLVNRQNYNQAVQIKRLKKCVGIAYREGYMDGYRDGHTDAENGHDERVVAMVNNEQNDERGAQFRRRAIKSDWKTHRMPRMNTRVELAMDITADEFEILAWGHIPESMDDRWFMYFDGEAFNFYRSWTGFCIYQVKVERCHDHYRLSYAIVNRSEKQYGGTDDEDDRMMCKELICLALNEWHKGLAHKLEHW